MDTKRSRSKGPLLLAWLGCGGVGSVALALVLFLLAGAVITALSHASFGGGSANSTSVSWDDAPFASSGSVISQVSHAWTGPSNPSVVNAALYVVSGLSAGPPDNYDVHYDATLIPDAIAYWQQTCPGCAAWAQNNVQCVMLIYAAYGMVHQLPTDTPSMNAITFWTSGFFADQAGWQMLPPTAIPYPGDIVVLDSGTNFGGVGHIVIVVDVALPGGVGQEGYVQFAEANGPGQLVQMPLKESQDGQLTMGIWHGYTVMGYIRHGSAVVSTTSLSSSGGFPQMNAEGETDAIS